MATRQANIKGIVFLAEPLGTTLGGTALVSFDLVSTPYTGGADTIQLGGGGTDQGAVTSATLATLMQNRRRDGKTVTIFAASPGPAPGAQAAATNGPVLYPQSVAVSAGNVTLNLFSAYTAGSAATTTVAAWDRAGTVTVHFTAV